MTALTPDVVQGFLIQRFTPAISANGLDPKTIGQDFDLLKAGVIDSLGVIEMISAVEQHFAVKVDFELMDPAELTILGPFSRFVAKNAVHGAPGT